ncbi:LysR family transcriptional regulator [Paraburkholderia sp. J63]|uniref:LysR family transcriptional regulator n=1 Tax=Paraburkholderia sp. J63 TaxID=2805434 RepID=UPI002ABDB3D8|nr:LysR family transcriptional regulator [Paraburkholderia sp. J63]
MRPLNSEEIHAFLLVVEKRSITEAARYLDLSKSVISKRISDLERDLGAQLLIRSTRGVAPTESGLIFYEAAADSMRRLSAVVETISEQTIGLCGELRIVAPVSFTQVWLGRVIAEFASRYPDLRIVAALDERIVNIEAERFDLAICNARPTDGGLIARRIGVSRRALVCSPAYIQKHGSPKTIEDIATHRCVCYSNVPVSQTWSFDPAASESQPRTLSPNSVFFSNNGEVLRDAAVAGVGLAVLPTLIVARDLAEGRLVRVLPNARPEDDIIYAVYPRNRFTSYKLRAFIEHIQLSVSSVSWDTLDFADAREETT